MSTNLTFVHLTDLHVNAPGLEDDHLFSDTTANLRRSLSEVKRLNPAPAFVIASGDLTNHGDAGSYLAFQNLLDEADLGIPVLLALGNHDDRTGFSAAFPERHSDPNTPYDHHCVIEGLHVITLDSSIPKAIGGDWEDGQIQWLSDRLADHTDLPKLLVMHHAPMLDPADTEMEWESLSAAGTEALRKAIQGHNVVGILSGHIHLDRVAHWNGVPVVIGMGNHAASDPVSMADGLRMLDGSGFAFCTLRDSGLTATFVPNPQTRDLRHLLTRERIQAYLAMLETETA